MGGWGVMQMYQRVREVAESGAGRERGKVYAQRREAGLRPSSTRSDALRFADCERTRNKLVVQLRAGIYQRAHESAWLFRCDLCLSCDLAMRRVCRAAAAAATCSSLAPPTGLTCSTRLSCAPAGWTDCCTWE